MSGRGRSTARGHGSIRGAAVAAAVAVVLLTEPASPQTTSEAWSSGVVLNFSTPGARSLGLGGAFLGLADDATAAYANPAGLTLLPQSEVSLEARSWRFEHRFTDRGRLEGEPTGDGVDTIAGLRDGRADDEVAGPSFVSVVRPFERWVIAFFGHTLADFEARFETQGALTNFTDGSARLFPTRNRIELEIKSLGLSSAYRVSESFALGLGLSFYFFEIDALTRRFRFQDNDFFAPPDFEEPVNEQAQMGKDSDVGLTVGFLWTIGPVWQVGGVARTGPKFEYNAKNVGLFRPEPEEFANQTATFKVPDQYGLGVAVRPVPQLSIALDYYRVEYSQFTDDLIDQFGRRQVRSESLEDYLRNFEAKDANEIHLGAEYLLLRSRLPFVLRAGVWFDPDHGLQYRGLAPGERMLFRQRERLIHFAAGAGISTRRFQLDVGIDHSERSTTASLSTVVRF